MRTATWQRREGDRPFAIARRRFYLGLTFVLIGAGAWVLSESLCDRHGAWRVFPGHALFHVLLAYGFVQCLVYPSLLRADAFGAHPRYLSEDPTLQERMRSPAREPKEIQLYAMGLKHLGVDPTAPWGDVLVEEAASAFTLLYPEFKRPNM